MTSILPYACRKIGPEELVELYPRLAELEHIYPGFRTWFDQKMAPGVRDGSREAIVLENGPFLAGLVLLARSPAQICGLWVPESHRGLGLSRRLIEIAIRTLGSSRPQLSAAASVEPRLAPTFRRFGFERTGERPLPGRSIEREGLWNGHPE